MATDVQLVEEGRAEPLYKPDSTTKRDDKLKKKSSKDKKKSKKSKSQSSSLHQSENLETHFDDHWVKDQEEEWATSIKEDAQSVTFWPDATSVVAGVFDDSNHNKKSPSSSLAEKSLTPQQIFRDIDRKERQRKKKRSSLDGSSAIKDTPNLCVEDVLAPQLIQKDQLINHRALYDMKPAQHVLGQQEQSSTSSSAASPASSRTTTTAASTTKSDFLLVPPLGATQLPTNQRYEQESRNDVPSSFQTGYSPPQGFLNDQSRAVIGDTGKDMFAFDYGSNAPLSSSTSNHVSPVFKKKSSMLKVDALALHTNMNEDVILADAKPLSLKHAIMDSSIRKMLCVGLFLMIAAIIVTTVVLVLPKSGSSINLDPTMAPSSSPTFIDDVIYAAAADVSGFEAFGVEGSPQLQAVGWLSAIDERSLDNSGPSFLQRYAMVVFYFSTGGSAWLSRDDWLNPALHECDWGRGIRCGLDNTNRRIITGVDTTRNGLSGKVPTELFEITSLEYILLAKNSLTGFIPAMPKLEKLEILDLSSNFLTGQIPPSIEALTSLKELHLSTNLLEGSIPFSIERLTDLEVLEVSENSIIGSLPSTLYTLSLLRTLAVSGNEMTGTLADEFANLQVLEMIDMRNNKFTGPYNPSFDMITTIDYLWLDYNLITGSFPEVVGPMGNRLEMTFGHNKMNGTLPSYINRRLQSYGSNSDFMFRIEKIDFSYNDFTGPLNPMIAFIPSAKYLDISGNQFTGQFPGDVGWLALEYLGASNCRFSGTIPIGFSSVSSLDFSNNVMTGGIPEGFCYMHQLESLKLNNNVDLGGTVPTCLGSATTLRHLALGNTNLLGTVPTEIGQLSKLEWFDVSDNKLTSEIPSAIGELTSLNFLDLSQNQFSGVIPTELGLLPFLRSLHVAYNLLTGWVPESLGNLTTLLDVSFAGNTLDGSIPTGLCQGRANLTTATVGCTVECSCCKDIGGC